MKGREKKEKFKGEETFKKKHRKNEEQPRKK